MGQPPLIDDLNDAGIVGLEPDSSSQGCQETAALVSPTAFDAVRVQGHNQQQRDDGT
jgi:hypothetical protein